MSRIKFSFIFTLCIALSQVSLAQTSPVCRSQAADADGDGFGFEDGASCIVTEDSAGPPAFVNQQTNAAVILVRAYWDGLTDFNNTVQCTVFNWNATTGGYVASTSQGATLTWSPLTTSAPYVGSVVRVTRSGRSSPMSWSMDNGIYSGPTALSRSPWFEVINVGEQTAVRSWSSSSRYHECVAVDPTKSFSPTGTPPGGIVTPEPDPQPSACVDTDPMGDGWGWDGVTSCSIAGVAPPVSSDTCIDTDPVGDGWGWDGVTSCSVAGVEQPDSSNICIDTDPVGDGWGWDGVTSCSVGEVEPPVTSDSCIDTDPVGDGWGWDGVTSCSVGGVEAPANDTCVDTIPLGNGWGWNGVTSCSVGGVETPVNNTCVDTVPVGDGWGWDGVTSCRI